MRPIEYIREFDNAAYLKDWRKAEEIIFHFLKVYFGNEYILNVNQVTGDQSLDFLAENREQKYKIGVSTKIRSSEKKVEINDLSKDIIVSTLEDFDKVLFITNGKYSERVRNLMKQFNLLDMQFLDIAYLKDWAKNYEKEIDPLKADYEKKVIEQSQYFIRKIAENEKYLEYIEWRELERIVGEIFSGLGFDAEVTECSKDGGKDVLLHYQGRKYLIEIKDWAEQRVGKESINKFLRVVFREDGERGLFLSTSGYCNNAFETLTEIEKRKLRVGDSFQIVNMARLYVRKNNGVYLPESNLDKLLEDCSRTI